MVFSGLVIELQLRVWTYIVGAIELSRNAFSASSRQKKPERTREDTLDLLGMTCVITGANAGIGFATAAALLKRGCHVILACRSLEKARRAAQELETTTTPGRGPAGTVEVAELDLSDLLSVSRFVQHFNKQRRPLHLIILNAGIMAPHQRSVTRDGFEKQFQVNYLSQWALARGLVAEQLERRAGHNSTAGSLRVVFLSSAIHVGGSLQFNDLQMEQNYSGFRGYANSKLAAVLAAKQFQTYFDRWHTSRRRDPGLECCATAVHPGMVDTTLAQGWLTGKDIFAGFLQSLTAPLLRKLAPLILVSPESTADTVIYAALAPAAQVKGTYIADSKVSRCSSKAQDPVLAQRLWDVSLQLTGSEPGTIEGKKRNGR